MDENKKSRGGKRKRSMKLCCERLCFRDNCVTKWKLAIL
uniref:Uncharacterized protein n=1 Tax=Anguilla anguilla TaxID=7936 RepID=A0A0E9PEV1_ANGAN